MRLKAIFTTSILTFSIAAAAVLFLTRQSEAQYREALQATLDQSLKTVEIAGVRLQEMGQVRQQIETEITLLRSQLDDQERRAQQLQETLHKERQEARSTRQELDQVKQAMAQLEDQLEEAERTRRRLEGRVPVARAAEPTRGVNISWDGAPKTAAASEARPVELETISVATNPTPKGKVLVVNKEFDFVVIDLGEQDSIEPGAILSVFRNREMVGKVQIDEVSERVAAASIISDGSESEILENDLVAGL
ncbi:MAG: hypothetical protein JW937_06385 [Candidatus Omnitrophica bacterium]|nr:hypothetical protein [Candidatus Omnitrophota bacterium]